MQCKNGCGEVALVSGISNKTGKPWRGGKCEACGVFNFDNSHQNYRQPEQQPNRQPIVQQPVAKVIVPEKLVKNGEINLAIDRAIEVFATLYTPECSVQPEDRIISLAKFFLALPSDLEIDDVAVDFKEFDEEPNQI